MRNHIYKNWFRYLIISLLPVVVQADEISFYDHSVIYKPAISIVIDDMGYRLESGKRAVNLPGALDYSFLPDSPHAKLLSKLAHDKNKEIMLHLPMESEGGNKLGPGGLTHLMDKKDFNEVLNENLASIPFISGFNNHMGSLLTQNPLLMKRVMRQVALKKALFFVDSRTTSNSVAYDVARYEGLRAIKRDVFIDHDASVELIKYQLQRLIKRARRKGTALAIAHPKKNTLDVLEKWLPELKNKNIELVPVTTLINLQQIRRLALWQQTTAH